MANTKKTKKKEEEKMVTPRKSVHVVFLSCPHCGTERDHIEMCLECNEPMRVIDVVEKFGDDAERFLKRVAKRNASKKVKEDDDYVSIDNEEPNIILMGDEDALNGDGGIDPNGDDDDGSLGVIFPDDDTDGTSKEVEEMDEDDDLTKALEQLDSEEDDDLTAQDFGFDDGEIPTL